MNPNSRKISAILLAGSLALGTVSACGRGADIVHRPEPTATEAADCDFDDLLQGNDKDCVGAAGRKAEKRLSPSQKERLRQAREAKKKVQTEINRVRPQVSRVVTIPKRVQPQSSTSRGSSRSSFFGSSSSKKSSSFNSGSSRRTGR